MHHNLRKGNPIQNSTKLHKAHFKRTNTPAHPAKTLAFQQEANQQSYPEPCGPTLPGRSRRVTRPVGKHGLSVYTGSSQRPLLLGTCPEYVTRSSSHLTWLHSNGRRSGCTLSPYQMTELLTLSLREIPETLQRKLISGHLYLQACSFSHYP